MSEIGEVLEKVHVLDVPNAGHDAMQDQGEMIGEAVEQFLGQ